MARVRPPCRRRRREGHLEVQQLCEKGQWSWFETPADPKSTDRRGLKAPAALLEVLPGMAAGVHRH